MFRSITLPKKTGAKYSCPNLPAANSPKLRNILKKAKQARKVLCITHT